MPLDEVDSEFGFGESHPSAIRDLLAYAYSSWEAPPRYMVLLGDGTYDFKDYLGTGVVNQVPPMMLMTSSIETASDPAYAAVNGNDLLPDLAIGRLPASSPSELERMVEKILDWEDAGHSLHGRAVVVADDPDQGGNFVAQQSRSQAKRSRSRRR